MKIGFIGGGNMAEALLKGITAHGMKEIYVSDPAAERRRYLKQHYNVETAESNTQIVAACDIIILAVKPQVMDRVTEEIGSKVTESKTIVSIAAGITLAYLSSRLNTGKLIRVMPNTPALVQKGMTVMSLCKCFSGRDVAAVRDIFMSVGEVITLPEEYMDTVTALSGSGPAFFALFVEAMIESGIKMGLTRDDASTLAVQTSIGTSRMFETGMNPARLREMVTSPGGTTASGLKTFHEKGLKDIVSAALASAKNRSEELGKGRS